MSGSPRYLNIPCTITIEIPQDFDLDNTTDEELFDLVVDQYGKYPEIDARFLGYEMVEEA